MISAKQQIRALLDQLPDDCSVEDVQYRLYVVQTIGRRLELAERSEVVPQAQAEARFERWLTK